MNILRMLKEMKQYHELLSESINVIERLALGGKKRRGRPPQWLSTETKVLPKSHQHRKPFSITTRKRMAAAQKKRWAKKAK